MVLKRASERLLAYAGAARDQHHGRQRQDLHGCGEQGVPSQQLADRMAARTRADTDGSGSDGPTPSRWRAETMPEIVALIERLIETRPRVRGGRRRLLQRRGASRRTASSPGSARRADRRAPRRARRGQALAARLRAVEGQQARRGHRPGTRPGGGAGPAGTSSARRWRCAHLGEDVRRARRRSRPDLPAPRERARTVRGRDRPAASPPRGCTTACCGSARRRCRSRSATSSAWPTRSTVGRETLLAVLRAGALPQPVDYTDVDARAGARDGGGSPRGAAQRAPLRRRGRRRERHAHPRTQADAAAGVRRRTAPTTSTRRGRWPSCTASPARSTRPWPVGRPIRAPGGAAADVLVRALDVLGLARWTRRRRRPRRRSPSPSSEPRRAPRATTRAPTPLRDEIAALGFSVRDTPQGPQVVPLDG